MYIYKFPFVRSFVDGFYRYLNSIFKINDNNYL